MISYFLNQSAQTIFNLQITIMCSLLIHNLIHKNFVLQLEVTGSRVARGQKWQVLGPQDIPLSRVTMVENIQINLFNQNIQSMIQFFRTTKRLPQRQREPSRRSVLCGFVSVKISYQVFSRHELSSLEEGNQRKETWTSHNTSSWPIQNYRQLSASV